MTERQEASLMRQVGLFALLLTVILLFVHRHQWDADLQRSGDDASYLSYAMSIGLDGDLDFTNELVYPNQIVPEYGVPRHFFGSGLMAAPFVALFSLVDRATGDPVITDHRQYRQSWSYFGFSVAVHVYCLSGLLLYWGIARRLMQGPVFLLSVFWCLTSGVSYYVFIRCRMAHGFEFFALALAAYAGIRLYESLKADLPIYRWIALGAVGTTLAIAVRLNNLNVLALPLLAALVPAARDSWQPEASRRLKLLVSPAACLIGLLLLLPVHFRLYGAWFPDMKVLHGLHGGGIPIPHDLGTLVAFLGEWLELLPHVPRILLGGEFGLLYTSPVLVLGIAAAVILLASGVRICRGPVFPSALLLLSLYILFSFTITLFWRNTGHSYGWRYLFPLFPLGFVGLAAFWSQASWPQPWRKATAAVFVILGLFAILSTILFAKTERLSYREETSAFGVLTQTAPDYVPNLARDLFTPEPWNVAIKDGLIGYVGKLTSKKSHEAVSPITGLRLGFLYLLWIGYAVIVIRFDAKRGEKKLSC